MKDLIKEIKSRLEFLEKVDESYITDWELGHHEGEISTLRFIFLLRDVLIPNQLYNWLGIRTSRRRNINLNVDISPSWCPNSQSVI